MFAEYQEYLTILEKKSPKTFLTYTTYLDKFFTCFKVVSVKDVEKLKTSDFRSFRDSVRGNESTKNLAIRIIRAFDNFLYSNEYVKDTSALDRLETLKEPKKVQRFLTDEEKKLLIASAKYSDVRAILALMIYGGLRRDEVVKLKKSDYQDQHILINGKGNRQRRLKLFPMVKELLDVYLAGRKDDCDALFVAHRSVGGISHPLSGQAIWSQVKNTCVRAGIDSKLVKPHTLRHTFISGLVNDGVNMILVRDLAGHSSLSTTERYSHTQNSALDSVIDSQ